jgi:hypothetical protein
MKSYLKHPFWQAVLLLVLAYVVIAFVIPLVPGSAVVPKSVVLQYMATVLVGILIWVSDEEERWTKFKEPLHDVLIQPRLKVVRNALLAVVTLIVGCFTYSQVRAGVAAPPNLRSIHPAPPSQITFRGKTITLVGLNNPLRRPGGGDMAAHLAVGRRVYYQNCVPCHGDHLDGQGHFASGLNPLPANFQDNGTIAQLTESFVFWRIAKGGPGCRARARPGIRRCRHGKNS